jgi:hypothetical protein
MLKTLEIQVVGNHNYLSLEPKISNIRIYSISTYDDNGKIINIYNGNLDLSSIRTFRYQITSSPIILLEVEHEYADALSIGIDIKYVAKKAIYGRHGYFISEQSKVMYGNRMFLHSKIANEGDFGISAQLSVIVTDINSRHIESFVATIPLNDDAILVESANKELTYEPKDVIVVVGDTFLGENEFTISGKTVTAKHDDAVVIYKPAIVKHQISQNAYIDSNFNIIMSNKDAYYIQYAVRIDMVNLDILSANTTPIIKELALVVKQ